MPPRQVCRSRGQILELFLEQLCFLGMINNYQRDAGTEDDRDSGTVSLISSLNTGVIFLQILFKKVLFSNLYSKFTEIFNFYSKFRTKCGSNGGATVTPFCTAILTGSFHLRDSNYNKKRKNHNILSSNKITTCYLIDISK